MKSRKLGAPLTQNSNPRSFGVSSDSVKNNLLITDKLFVPKSRGLPASGSSGQIVFNSGDSTFYGWNGSEWMSLPGTGGGSGGFERVTGDTINPNVATSLIVSATGGGMEWGSQVGGTWSEYNDYYNNNAINGSNQSIICVNVESDPVIIYNGDGSIAFTVANTGEGSSYDSLFVKYSSSGSATLTGKTSSTEWCDSTAIGLNDDGYSVITGYYRDTDLSVYDGSNSFVLTLPNEGSEDAYVIVYSPSSSLQWAAHIGGLSSEQGYACAINNSNNVVVSGYFYSTITVYSGDASAFTIVSAEGGNSNRFIVKYGSAGEIDWTAKLITNSVYSNQGPGDINNNGKVLFGAAGYSDILVYNSDGTPSVTLELNGFNNLGSILSYSPSGTLNWAATIRSSSVNLYSARLNSSNDIVATGYYYTSDELNIYDSGDNLVATLPAGGDVSDYDAFLLKYNSLGNLEWATRISGLPSVQTFVYGISTDINDSGDIVVYGAYDSTLVVYDRYGNLAASLQVLNNSGDNVFLVSYASEGAVKWATRIGGENADANPNGVSLNNLGNIVVSGYYDTTINVFNSDGTCALTLSNDGNADVFVVKYNSAGQVSLGNPVTDGQLKMISTTGSVLVNTSSPIDGVSTGIQLNTYDSVNLLWDAVESNWIVVCNEGTLI